MKLEKYKELLQDLKTIEDYYVFSFVTNTRECIQGKIIGTKSPIVYFGDVESGGEPTLLTIELMENGNKSIEEKMNLSVEDIDSYIVYKKAFKPNSNF